MPWTELRRLCSLLRTQKERWRSELGFECRDFGEEDVETSSYLGFGILFAVLFWLEEDGWRYGVVIADVADVVGVHGAGFGRGVQHSVDAIV